MGSFLKFLKYIEPLTLALLSIIIIVLNGNGTYFIRLLILFLASVSTEYCLAFLLRTKPKPDIKTLSFPFLIFILVSPNLSLFITLFAVVLSHLTYAFLRYEGREIFNPVVLSGFLFSLYGLKITWWGVNVGFSLILLLIITGLINNYFDKTLKLTFTYFLLIAAFSLLFSLNPLYSIKQVFVPGLLFFGFFLANKNIPSQEKNSRFNLFYIFCVALLGIIIPKFGFFTDPLLSSIVVSDFVFFSIRLFYPKILT